MDESRRTERKAFRRRSLVALASSLTLHGALFALLIFLIPTGGSGASASLAVSLGGGGGAMPGGASVETAHRTADGAPLAPASPDRSAVDGNALADAVGTGGPLAEEDKGASADRSASPIAEGAPSGSDGAAIEPAPVGTRGGRPGGLGEDGGGDSGGAAPGAAAGAKDGDPAAALAARVLAAVEARKAYPEPARRRGTEGTVRLKFSVAEDGRLLSAKLVTSSGSALLDSAALELFSSVFPVENPARRELDGLTLSISYGIRR